MKGKFKSIMAAGLAVAMAMTAACGKDTVPPSQTEASETVSEANAKATNAEKTIVKEAKTDGDNANVEMTDVGTPRNETLIVDILNGNSPDPMQMNPYLPGCVALDSGLHQLIFVHLWEINSVKGAQEPALAADMPEDISDGKYTKFRFHIREGVKWSDGVDLTAEDVEFTADMIMNTPEFSYNAYFTSLVKSMKAVDKYTIEIELNNPETRLVDRLGAGYTSSFKVVPKHIWEKEDPKTFKNSDCIGAGPYVLTKRDEQQGNWYLFEKRDDWQNTDVGIKVGEPGPKYMLFKFFGTEEKRVMAAVNNEIDILQDISPESWEILRKKNENFKAWYDEFPYADMDDACARGISFNCEKEPYNNEDVRWALTLATDIKAVSMATFSGMLRVTPISAPPVSVVQDTYQEPMLGWLKEFELKDGYKPFDDTYASSMVEMLKQQGIEGLPSDEEEMVNTFGVGWWKYDVEEAGKLLTDNGFTQKDGKWYLPDGTLWTIVLNAPADFEIESMRLAFAVADSWKKFGIDVQVKQLDSATFWNAESTGDFEAGAYWPACGNTPDMVEGLAGWNQKYYKPTGEIAFNNAGGCRYKNEEISEILDSLESVPPSDPKVIEGATDVYKLLVQGRPFIPMFGTSKFVPVNTTYWQGFQSSTNYFEGPWWWWSQFKYYTPHFQPAE
ncbi:ABC transporter substrate-binding protein [Murimonas intestini]|uniref:ABC transporter substrate-binding protein n=1 Tax=Murimonas intestini TaxID=1337051 RepID=UPI0011DD6E46|nr:ABC transporter substrate-binding protein [Murimonas intestini]